MVDPVVDEFGHSYEKHALERHIEMFSRSPLTNDEYTTYDGILNCFGYTDGPMIVQNFALKHAITEFWNLCVCSLRKISFDVSTPRNRRNAATPVTPVRRQPTAPPSTPTTPVLTFRSAVDSRRIPRNVVSVHPTHTEHDDTTDDEVDELIDEGYVPDSSNY